MDLDQFSTNQSTHKDFWSYNDPQQEHETATLLWDNPSYNYEPENDVGQGFNLMVGADSEQWNPCNDGASAFGSESCFFGDGGRTNYPVDAAQSKRRRPRRVKNKEEVENQRMTHIAVERNRRKQMNEYLAELRSIMPSSYVQRGDQASIVGGAINFVKELEQVVQSLEAKKHTEDINNQSSPKTLFSDFFIFPQYSTCSSSGSDHPQSTAEKRSPAADVEVTMVDSHANIKVMMRGQRKQLLKMVVGLQCLGLVVLHLNVTTVDNMVLFSFSAKVEEDCQMTSVNEIAASVFELVGQIQEDQAKFV